MPRARIAIEPLFLVVDKPAGLSSHDVVAIVRAVTGIKKVGHTGTLDPFATGVLPLAIGTATRLIHFLPEDTKTYVATLKLGQSTDTGDCEGKITEEKPCPKLGQDLIEAVFQQFLGEQLQTPPMYSALKVNGRRAYDYARAGETMSLQPRAITVQSLSLLTIDGRTIIFKATVSKGTYVRTLGEAIAKKLGTVGHLIALRRLQSGPFNLLHAMSFDQLAEYVSPGHLWKHAFLSDRDKRPIRQSRNSVRHKLLPFWLTPQEVFVSFPSVELSDNGAKLAQNGNIPNELPAVNSEHLLLFHQNKLIAICIHREQAGVSERKWVFGRVISSEAVSIQSLE